MIEEILINNGIGGKQRVVVFPTRTEPNPRVYVEPSRSSRKRLDKMIRKYDTRIYVQKDGITVWIRR
jgi:hypothetical protein